MKKKVVEMIRKILLVNILGLMFVTSGHSMARDPEMAANGAPPLVVTSGKLPGIQPETEFADFWSRSYTSPDRVLMTPAEIEEFNASNPQFGQTILDIPSLADQLDGVPYRRSLENAVNSILTGTFYVTGDIPLEEYERRSIAGLIDPSRVPDVINTRLGMTLRPVIGRNWPTQVLLTGTPNDNEFDSTVASLLDTAEPVALIHTSADGLWAYVQTYGFACWVPSDAVAFGDRETVLELTDRSNPIVITGHLVTIKRDPSDPVGVTSARMGTYFPIRGVGNSWCRVLYPGRDQHGALVAMEGFVERNSSMSMGFLPYTKRNVYSQMFVPYGRRYGWGGMYGERDCSAYVLEVFRCFNIRLPRNSLSQLQASRGVIRLDAYPREEKLSILKSCPQGITLVGFPGHVMIYLGEYNGSPYAVSSLWAWRSPPRNGREIVNRTASIIVSDFSLGKGSERGSFAERITHIAIIGNYVIQQD